MLFMIKFTRRKVDFMLIHKMRLDDNMAVLDVNSGSVHVVDDLAYDVIPV